MKMATHGFAVSLTGGGVSFLTGVWVSLITEAIRNPSPSSEVPGSFGLVLHLSHQEACVSLQRGPQNQTDLIHSISCWTWGEALWVKASLPTVREWVQTRAGER